MTTLIMAAEETNKALKVKIFKNNNYLKCSYNISHSSKSYLRLFGFTSYFSAILSTIFRTGVRQNHQTWLFEWAPGGRTLRLKAGNARRKLLVKPVKETDLGAA